MIKFTLANSVYYLKKSVIYGFCVFSDREGYKLRLLDTTENGYYDLGVFESKDICDKIIYDIEMCVVTGIIDVDFIIQKEIENYERVHKKEA